MYPNLKFAKPIFRKGMQQTIRIMSKIERTPRNGDIFTILDTENNNLGCGFILMVEEYSLKDLPLNVVGMSHDPRTQIYENLVKDIMKYYNVVEENTEVTVIWFRILPIGKLGEELGISNMWI